MQFTDRMALDGKLRRTKEGYAVTSARVARGGNVQAYRGTELGIADKEVIRVYRPEEEVFKRDALASYAGAPITLRHPAQPVNAENWKDLAMGEVGDEVVRDGEFVRVPMMLRDVFAIAAVETGVSELSMGYDADLTIKDGVSPAGDAYDAVMTNFRMNHVALVERARGGSQLCIGDGAKEWGIAPVITDHLPEKEKPMTLKTVTVDGIPIEVTDQGATVIATLQARIADAAAKHTAEMAASAAALAAKDADLAKKDAEIDGLKGKVLSDADLDKRVAGRADLIATAKTIAKDVKTEGLSDADIRKATVRAVLGDAALEGKADAYIDARFEILAEDAKKGGGSNDPFRTVVQNGIQTNDSRGEPDKAYAGMVSNLTDAWKGETKGAA